MDTTHIMSRGASLIGGAIALALAVAACGESKPDAGADDPDKLVQRILDGIFAEDRAAAASALTPEVELVRARFESAEIEDEAKKKEALERLPHVVKRTRSRVAQSLGHVRAQLDAMRIGRGDVAVKGVEVKVREAEGGLSQARIRATLSVPDGEHTVEFYAVKLADRWYAQTSLDWTIPDLESALFRGITMTHELYDVVEARGADPEAGLRAVQAWAEAQKQAIVGLEERYERDRTTKATPDATVLPVRERRLEELGKRTAALGERFPEIMGAELVRELRRKLLPEELEPVKPGARLPGAHPVLHPDQPGGGHEGHDHEGHDH